MIDICEEEYNRCKDYVSNNDDIDVRIDDISQRYYIALETIEKANADIQKLENKKREAELVANNLKPTIDRWLSIFNRSRDSAVNGCIAKARKPWSSEEDRVLLSKTDKVPMHKIAKQLGRTSTSCYARLAKISKGG